MNKKDLRKIWLFNMCMCVVCVCVCVCVYVRKKEKLVQRVRKWKNWCGKFSGKNCVSLVINERKGIERFSNSSRSMLSSKIKYKIKKDAKEKWFNHFEINFAKPYSTNLYNNLPSPSFSTPPSTPFPPWDL